MKILAFAGSTSSTSRNRELVKFTLTYFSEHEIDLIDLNDYEMPIFSVDREFNGYPPEAYRFLEAIKESDVIICSLAEHNRSYSAAFKNIFDWASRINAKVFQNKPMLLMSTSPGKFGGGNVMNTAKTFFPQFGADVKVTFSLPSFDQTFVIGKGVVDADLLTQLENSINQFKQAV
ncbi:MAG: NADPH-dependent FMN reductase [Cytophagaceae bacterium]